MTKSQRIILLIGAICILHSSMVPPVSQTGGETCRYHEFTERSPLFTRAYGVNGGDGVALMTEIGVIVALVSIALLATTFVRRSVRES